MTMQRACPTLRLVLLILLFAYSTTALRNHNHEMGAKVPKAPKTLPFPAHKHFAGYGPFSMGSFISVYYKEKGRSRMAELVYRNGIIFNSSEVVNCFLYGEAQVIYSKVYFVPAFFVREVNQKQMRDIISLCEQVFRESPYAKPPSAFQIMANPELFASRPVGGLVIYPGTKWCGMGNIADDYDDLGTERETDKCCRDHDHCFDNIPSGETKHNLTNTAIYTKSHCECDRNFSRCLRDNNKPSSDDIGNIYFNVLQIQCFEKNYPIVGCLKSWGIFPFYRSCQKYKLDKGKPKKWQFFDARLYRSSKDLPQEEGEFDQEDEFEDELFNTTLSTTEV